jgi:DinB family protein
MSRYPELLERLHAGRDEFVSAVDGVTSAQSTARPAGGGWSILECAEHVVLVEALLFGGVGSATPLPEGLQRNIEARIIERGIDRSRKFEAPEGVRPGGRFPALPDALNAFLGARAATIAWVESCDQDLRRSSAPHPMFGPVTVYEMMLFIAMHPMRHALQVRELRAVP